MNFSLVSKQAAEMTLESVTRPGVMSVRKIMDELGYETTLYHLTKLLVDADLALGGDGDAHRCQVSAATIMLNTQHRSYGFIALAIREGLSNPEHGKAYGKINTQLVNTWIAAQENRILGIAESEHAKYTVRGDNWRGQDLDRLERSANRDKARISHLSDQLRDLKEKLSEKQ